VTHGKDLKKIKKDARARRESTPPHAHAPAVARRTRRRVPPPQHAHAPASRPPRVHVAAGRRTRPHTPDLHAHSTNGWHISYSHLLLPAHLFPLLLLPTRRAQKELKEEELELGAGGTSFSGAHSSSLQSESSCAGAGEEGDGDNEALQVSRNGLLPLTPPMTAPRTRLS